MSGEGEKADPLGQEAVMVQVRLLAASTTGGALYSACLFNAAHLPPPPGPGMTVEARQALDIKRAGDLWLDALVHLATLLR